MRISSNQIDAIVQHYIERITALLPSGCGISEFISGGKRDDTKMLRMLRLKDSGCPLRLCTLEQVQILILKIMGRKTITIAHKSKTGHNVIDGCKTRSYTNQELADLLGCTVNKIGKMLHAARHAVKMAIRENCRCS